MRYYHTSGLNFSHMSWPLQMSSDELIFNNVSDGYVT
jgi:hypothetical protein